MISQGCNRRAWRPIRSLIGGAIEGGREKVPKGISLRVMAVRDERLSKISNAYPPSDLKPRQSENITQGVRGTGESRKLVVRGATPRPARNLVSGGVESRHARASDALCGDISYRQTTSAEAQISCISRSSDRPANYSLSVHGHVSSVAITSRTSLADRGLSLFFGSTVRRTPVAQSQRSGIHRRVFTVGEPYDPPKIREGVCKMCGEVKLIREDEPLCEECWEYNKDL